MADSIRPTTSTNTYLVQPFTFGVQQHKMNPTEINRAIAELCGWTYGPIDLGDGLDVDEQSHVWWREGRATLDRPPNYHASLDACAGFEATIATPSDKCAYIVILDRVITGPGIVATSGAFSQTTATAPQRCEAFLRMHGKWMLG